MNIPLRVVRLRRDAHAYVLQISPADRDEADRGVADRQLKSQFTPIDLFHFPSPLGEGARRADEESGSL